jgi:hypothetical protein
MAFASHVSLSRLLLQRSDQHPVRIVDGRDLGDQRPETVRHFVRLGILVEREGPTDLDGVIIQRSGQRVIAVNLDGDGITTEIDPECVRQYDIDLMALCRQLRQASGLEGRPVEKINAAAFWLGATGTGSRRIEYYFARRLRAANALDVAFALKGHANGLTIVVLTPTERDLPGTVRRQLDAAGVTVAAIDGMLDVGSAEPLKVTIPTLIVRGPPSASARLTVDVQGASARFDGTLLSLRRREFQVLVRLANERVNEDGWVNRDAISDALRAATASDDRNDEQIDKVVSNLRRALRAAGVTEGTKRTYPIESSRGQGYRLLVPQNDIHIF